MILDLHMHSKFSFDSLSKPKDIIITAKKRGLNGVAITDHDTIKGGVEARKINQDPDFLVIVGAEIATDIGDIIGLFLGEEIESRDSIKVVEEIHGQGGVAVLPHPYKGHRLNEEVIRQIDIIEIFNSRASVEQNRQAAELAKQYNKPVIAGSDAHFCFEIGTCKVKINSDDIRNEILNGKLELKTEYTPPYVQSMSQIIKSVKLRKYNRIPRQFGSLMANMLIKK